MVWLFICVEFITLLMTIVIAFIRRGHKSLHPIRLFLIVSLLARIAIFLLPDTAESIYSYRIEFNLFTMLDVTCIFYYFSTVLTGKIRRLTLLMSYLLISGIAINYLIIRPDGLRRFNSVFYGIQNLFITVPCILYLYTQFRSDDENDLKTNPHFIATCGILFFYATTFPFYITYKTLLDVTPQMNAVLGGINAFLNSILYITFMKAFLCPYPEQK